MKRRIGRIFIKLGTVLIVLALSLFVYNQWEAEQARKAAEEIVSLIELRVGEDTEAPDLSGTDLVGVMPATDIDGFDYIGTLIISRYGLELPVMSDWSYSGLKYAPGRYSGSVWADDLVICGHNYERHFGKLKDLEAGDEIIFTDLSGNEFIYRVEEVITLQPTDVEEMLSQESCDWDLTLFTCTANGQARVTVRCSMTE